MLESAPSGASKQYKNTSLKISNSFRYTLRAMPNNKFEPRLSVSVYGTLVSFSYFEGFSDDGVKPPNKANFYIVPLGMALGAFIRRIKELGDDNKDVKYTYKDTYKDVHYTIAVSRLNGTWRFNIGDEDPTSLDNCPDFLLTSGSSELEMDGSNLTSAQISTEYALHYLESLRDHIANIQDIIAGKDLTVFAPENKDVLS